MPRTAFLAVKKLAKFEDTMQQVVDIFYTVQFKWEKTNKLMKKNRMSTNPSSFNNEAVDHVDNLIQYAVVNKPKLISILLELCTHIESKWAMTKMVSLKQSNIYG